MGAKNKNKVNLQLKQQLTKFIKEKSFGLIEPEIVSMSETDAVAEPGGGVIYARKTKVQPILIPDPGLISSPAGGLISKAPTSGEEATIVDPIQLLPPAQENGEKAKAESASTLFAKTKLAASPASGSSESSEKQEQSKCSSVTQEEGDKDKVKIKPLLKPVLGDNFTRPVNEDEDKPPQLSPSLAESPRPRIPRQLLQFKCPECQKTYPNRNTLQVHMGTHPQTTNEMFGCGYCDKTFRWKQSLKNHERTHEEGFQPYTCNKCDKSFTLRSSWYTHIRAVSCSTRNRKQSFGLSQKSPDTPSVESKAKRQSAPNAAQNKQQIEQSGLPIKKRGRPAKIRSASLTNETESMKKSKVVSKPELNKSNNPDIPAKKSERIPSNSSVVLEPTSASNGTTDITTIKTEPDSPEPSARAQRKRNPPKWTENMVMDYDIAFAGTPPRGNRASGSRKSSMESNSNSIESAKSSRHSDIVNKNEEAVDVIRSTPKISSPEASNHERSKKHSVESREISEMSDKEQDSPPVKSDDSKKAEDAKKLADPKKFDDSKKVENIKKLDDSKKSEDSKKFDDSKKTEDLKKLNDPKKIEEKVVDSAKTVRDPKKVEEPKKAEVPKTAENPKKFEELKTAEKPKKVEEPKTAEKPKKVEEPKRVEEPKTAENPKKFEEPKTAENPKKVEEPKTAEKPKKVEEPKRVEEPKTAENPKKVENTRKIEETKKVEDTKKVDETKKVEDTKKVEETKKVEDTIKVEVSSSPKVVAIEKVQRLMPPKATVDVPKILTRVASPTIEVTTKRLPRILMPPRAKIQLVEKIVSPVGKSTELSNKTQVALLEKFAEGVKDRSKIVENEAGEADTKKSVSVDATKTVKVVVNKPVKVDVTKTVVANANKTVEANVNKTVVVDATKTVKAVVNETVVSEAPKTVKIDTPKTAPAVVTVPGKRGRKRKRGRAKKSEDKSPVKKSTLTNDEPSEEVVEMESTLKVSPTLVGQQNNRKRKASEAVITTPITSNTTKVDVELQPILEKKSKRGRPRLHPIKVIPAKPEELAVPIVEKVASPLPPLPVIDPSPNSATTESVGVEPSNGPSPQPLETSIPAATFTGMPRLLNQISPPVEFVGEGSDKSSDSEEESMYANINFMPPGGKRVSKEPYIKDEAIRFLANKISNRNMLRIRQELMQLKQSGNYFKLTKTAPLAAGLIHDMFCQILES